MKRIHRTQLRIVAAAIAATALVAAGLVPALSSTADVPASNGFAQTANASDPYLYRCANGAYCMVTSEDLGDASGVYHMTRTIAYSSTNGLGWGASSTAIQESSIPGVPANSKHLWAPTVRYYKDSGGTARYNLYVPDLTTSGNTYSSRIYVGTSNSPVGFTSNGTKVSGVGNTTNYMSDPEVFSDSATPETDLSKDYLLWANGDNGSCGQLSIEKMTNSTTLDTIGTAANPNSRLIVNGWPANAWAKCTYRQGPPPPSGAVAAGTTINEPYIEGGSLFKFSNFKYVSQDGNPAPGPYTLVFALKPSSTPAQCAGGAQPNTANEVIAYATSSTVTGPYTFQGIIMCGSATEWTNQATIEEVRTASGEWRLVIVYHDGPSGNNNRKLHSECLFTNSNGLGFKLASSGVGVTRTSEGAVDINGNRQWCLSAPSVVALKTSSGKYVQANGSGTLKLGGTTIGDWEEFSWDHQGNQLDFLNARNGKKYVTRAADGTMTANGTSAGNGQRLWLVQQLSNTYEMKDITTGKFVVVGADGVLRATSSDGTGATIFTMEVLAK
jgi:hypothetical protein